MQLAGNEIHLYLVFPDRISDTDLLRSYETLLSSDESAQLSRFYYAGHRKQYLLTRALLRTSLSAYHTLGPRDWRFQINGYGKPSLDPLLPGQDTRFNLSHTNGLIACAITTGVDIGIDVEDSNRTTRAALNDLSRYFSGTEINALAALPPERQKQRFFDYWTLKESYIKARGMGLAIPLGKFSFVFANDSLQRLELHPDLQDDAASWQFWRAKIAGRYRMAVAVNSGEPGFKLTAFNTVPLQQKIPIQLSFS